MEENMVMDEVLTGDVVDTNETADLVETIDAQTELLHDDISLLAKLIGFLAALGGIGTIVASGFGIKKLIDFLKGKFGGKKKSKKSKKSSKKSKKVEEDDTSDDDDVDEDSEE